MHLDAALSVLVKRRAPLFARYTFHSGRRFDFRRAACLSTAC